MIVTTFIGCILLWGQFGPPGQCVNSLEILMTKNYRMPHLDWLALELSLFWHKYK
jgi:hypothetical protein